jgi:transposase-like protein
MLLPPLNLSMAEVSRREGVSEMSLSNWRKQLSSEGNAVSENKP